MKMITVQILLLVLVFAPFTLARGSPIVKLEPTADGLLKVHAIVAGHAGTFLFDSGSGFSNISPGFASTIGCHPWGQITGFRMTGQRLDVQHCDHVTLSLAGRSFSLRAVGVFDLSKYLPSEVGPIDGTIALDLFANKAFTFSYGGHFIRLLDRNDLALRSKRLKALPLHVVRDAEGLALTVNFPVITSAGTAWFELDSGNTSPFTIVSKAIAPLFGLTADDKGAPWICVHLADAARFQGKARVLDLILDGNLGTSFLSSHDVTIDLERATAWVSTYTPSEPHENTR